MHICNYCGQGILNIDMALTKGVYYHKACLNAIRTNQGNCKDPLIETNPLLKESEKLFKMVFETLYKKNSDYSLADQPFSNFENSAKRVGITVEQGILVRFNDKVERLCNLLRQNKAARVTGETIEDTIQDAIGYLAILYAFRMGQMAGRQNKNNG